jgi:hypothetical protein
MTGMIWGSGVIEDKEKGYGMHMRLDVSARQIAFSNLINFYTWHLPNANYMQHSILPE